ncbi:MAG TPA: c(7)-type cytochrome triheme domain-containing protein [Anaerolineales bacterium]
MGFLKRSGFLFLLLLFTAFTAYGMRITPPHEYGRVILNNYSRGAGIAPAVFDHWLHRAMFTCRLCHVDIGFAMEGSATKIRAATNRDGFHCGACHNGKTAYKGKSIFASCLDNLAREDSNACGRCHSVGDQDKKKKEFNEFIENFPRKGHGNTVDWEGAETKGLIKPLDFIEDVSIKRSPLKMEKEISIESRGTWMSDVMFSHKKHAIWNGCEVCHPEIFPSTKQGTVKYSMFQIANGEYCGVCHDKVAFPIIDCQRCHVQPVR